MLKVSSPENWIKGRNCSTKTLVSLHVLFASLTFILFVCFAWTTYWPPFMFGQHYISAIASGLFCLAVSTESSFLLIFEIILGLIALACNICYLSQSMYGSWEGNFDGDKLFPYTLDPKVLNITAQNLSSIDTGYTFMVLEISFTFAILAIQNVILNVIIPAVILRMTPDKEFNKSEDWDCNDLGPTFVFHGVLGLLISCIGLTQGVLSLYYATNGVMILTRISNPLYLLYFIVTAGIIPAPGLNLTDDRRPYTWHDINGSKVVKAGFYNYLYLAFFVIVWVLTGANISINAAWSQSNYLGGYACPSFENVTMTLSGENTLLFNDVQEITYNNLNGDISTAGYPERVDRTNNNIEAISSFSCAEIWLNWIVLGLSLIFFILNIIVVAPHKS